MRNQILFLLFTLFLASAAQAEPHHCHDQATNKQWGQIKRTHRGERDVEAQAAIIPVTAVFYPASAVLH
jgi:hypothetical protein